MLDQNQDCIVILTSRGKEQLIKEKGCQGWVLSPEHAKQCQYVVCVQNKNLYREGQTKHHKAFLVGKISNVTKASDDENRWKVEFDEYADINLLINGMAVEILFDI